MNVKSQYDLDIGGREKKDLQDYLNNLDKKKHEKLITSYRVEPQFWWQTVKSIKDYTPPIWELWYLLKKIEIF